jgi:Arc/MetJ-type ribon-helix-helix transcriptional regulator
MTAHLQDTYRVTHIGFKTTEQHAETIAEMAKALNVSKSELVRFALEKLLEGDQKYSRRDIKRLAV